MSISDPCVAIPSTGNTYQFVFKNAKNEIISPGIEYKMATTSTPTRIDGQLPTAADPAIVGANKGVLVTSSTEADRTNIIAPFIGAATGSSSATGGVLTQEQVIMSGIDAVMSVTATEEEAVQLLNCFTIREMNTPYTIAGTAALDYAADPNHKLPLLDVDVSGGVDNFASVLRALVDRAHETAPNDHSSVVTYFNEEMRRMLNAYLSQSGLIDMLEASNVDNVSVVLDVSGGVDDIESKIVADDAAARRRLFATQVPIKNYDAYGFPEGTLTMAFLPLVAGDSITFVFDITVSPPASLTATGSQVVSSLGEGAVTLQTTGAGYATTLTTFVANTIRRVAFTAKLHAGNKPFGKKYDEAAIIQDINEADCTDEAAAQNLAHDAVLAAVFSLQTDASAGTYADPSGAPVLVFEESPPYSADISGGETDAATDASSYVWTVAIPLWAVGSNAEPAADVSGETAHADWEGRRDDEALRLYNIALPLYTTYYANLATAEGELRTALREWAVKSALYAEYIRVRSDVTL
jgi:hypothetical protein